LTVSGSPALYADPGEWWRDMPSAAPSWPTGALANGRSLDADGGRTVAYKLD